MRLIYQTYFPLIAVIAINGGCASEPNLTDLQEQVQAIALQQKNTQQFEQETRDRLGAIESQLDEHDFLVGELIKTEEEANLDTRHLLDKLERTGSKLREQIDQTRQSTQRRDQDLSIRVKALEGRIDNMIHRPRSRAMQTTTPPPTSSTESLSETSPKDSGVEAPSPQNPDVENEATAFRSAYKVYLNGNYDHASIAFRRFVKHYPATALTPPAFYYLGQSFYFQKQYDPAKQALEFVVSNFPNNKYRIQALFALGQIMLETDQPTQAQELWNQIIEDYPDSPEAANAKEQIKKAGLS